MLSKDRRRCQDMSIDGQCGSKRVTNSSSIEPGVFFSSCSQIRITVQPRFRSAEFTSTSFARFRPIFLSQNSLFDSGAGLHSQPCQKHPSMNTAILSLGKAKSGLPIIRGLCRRHPVIFASRSSERKASSVDLFPLLRTAAILQLRCSFECRSATLTFNHKFVAAKQIRQQTNHFVA